MTITNDSLVDRIRDFAHPLIGSRSDLDPLLDKIGDRSIVLLGEATHGTHEFYSLRFEITKRLIEEKGFAAIAIEADWPDVLHVNRFIHGHQSDSHIMESLGAFQRFPMWMWRNSDFLDMVEWLWVHNRRESTDTCASLFGIDLYSLYKSMDEVIGYLERNDPEAATRAKSLYACFDHYDQDPVRYGRFVRVGAQPSCEQAAAQAVANLFENVSAASTRSITGHPTSDELFFAKQNAELVRNAESYYRNLFSPLVNTWNVRDTHMADTIDNLLAHLASERRAPKVVIWAHNSHVGDDRATEMGWHGQVNIGQLLRERHPGETFTLGFTTYTGAVMAASQWDHPPMLKSVRPALRGSFEALFHDVDVPSFYLDFEDAELNRKLAEPRLERAIGVIYSPETERASHYFEAKISEQFDAVIHVDQTREVEPLDRLAQIETAAPSEIQF